MNCILGLVLKDEINNYKFDKVLISKHSNEARIHRFNLILSNKSLYHFEVYRFIDKSRQVHVILEDGTILIFNKSNKKLITAILASPKLINEYLSKLVDIDCQSLNVIIRCCKLNEKYNVNSKELQEPQLTEYLQKKKKILS